jgi:hypothetical protein
VNQIIREIETQEVCPVRETAPGFFHGLKEAIGSASFEAVP